MDTIYRQAAIDVILSGKVDEDDSLVECAIECNSFLDWAADEVAKMPSAPRWIPCEERLPEEDTEVLVTGENGEIDIALWKYDSWTEDDVVVWEGNSFSWIDPVAWMPLPEPWKGE